MSQFDDSDAFEAAATSSLASRAMAARPAPYMDGLNPEQIAAVNQLDGPVLMLAGAVRAYANRYGVTPGQKVAVFTNTPTTAASLCGQA